MIYNTISKYHTLSKQDKHHRFKSWEHCFQFFQSNYKKLDKEDVLDHASLHLAFYLASWGMMRGGTFLLQKDYRIHEYFRRAVVADSSTYRLYDLRTNELT